MAELSIQNRKNTNLIKAIKSNIAKHYQLYLMLLIPVAVVIIFNYIPMYGVQIAFRNFKAVDGILGSEWVGLKYFEKFIHSYQFGRIIRNTFAISIYSLIAGFPIPILLALALNNTKMLKFKKTVQMVTYAPFFISTVVMVGIILQFSSPKLGIINQFIELFGGEAIVFMAEPKLFSSIYVLSGIWQGAGWGSIIYLAALAGIDPSLHEAAVIDGASIVQRIIHIDIPGIMPTIVMLLILNFGGLMSVGFEKILLMQNPLNLQTSEVISTYVYKIAFASNLPNYSYSAAIGLFNAIINFTLLIIFNHIAKKTSETSLW